MFRTDPNTERNECVDHAPEYPAMCERKVPFAVFLSSGTVLRLGYTTSVLRAEHLWVFRAIAPRVHHLAHSTIRLSFTRNCPPVSSVIKTLMASTRPMPLAMPAGLAGMPTMLTLHVPRPCQRFALPLLHRRCNWS